MRVKTELNDLTGTQWRLINDTVLTRYEFTERSTRVCVVFERGGEERHAEMPLSVYIGILAGLGMADGVESLAALAASVPPETAVRNNCAFCHRERSAGDDNHTPDCPYWSVGPGSLL